MAQNSEEKFISLKEASELCSYSEPYLRLRAREGKLKAVKIGRNWATTKEWLDEFLQKNLQNQNRRKQQIPKEKEPIQAHKRIGVEHTPTTPLLKTKKGILLSVPIFFLLTLFFLASLFSYILANPQPFFSSFKSTLDPILGSFSSLKKELQLSSLSLEKDLLFSFKEVR